MVTYIAFSSSPYLVFPFNGKKGPLNNTTQTYRLNKAFSITIGNECATEPFFERYQVH